MDKNPIFLLNGFSFLCKQKHLQVNQNKRERNKNRKKDSEMTWHINGKQANKYNSTNSWLKQDLWDLPVVFAYFMYS